MSTIAAAPAAERKPLYASLFVQVLAALVLGVILGMAVPDFAISLKILSDAFLNVIPTTSFDALSRNDVLQVLFFAVLFGVGLALVGGEKGALVTSMIDAASTVLFRVMGLIVRVAPLGVLGAVAYTVGKYGVGSL